MENYISKFVIVQNGYKAQEAIYAGGRLVLCEKTLSVSDTLRALGFDVELIQIPADRKLQDMPDKLVDLIV